MPPLRTRRLPDVIVAALLSLLAAGVLDVAVSKIQIKKSDRSFVRCGGLNHRLKAPTPSGSMTLLASKYDRVLAADWFIGGE
jgi:hypothetical protein